MAPAVGHSPNQGRSPLSGVGGGGAKPRLTSAGEAGTSEYTTSRESPEPSTNILVQTPGSEAWN